MSVDNEYKDENDKQRTMMVVVAGGQQGMRKGRPTGYEAGAVEEREWRGEVVSGWVCEWIQRKEGTTGMGRDWLERVDRKRLGLRGRSEQCVCVRVCVSLCERIQCPDPNT